jgi:hypothetical protein
MLDNQGLRVIAALLLRKINYRGDFTTQELSLGRNNKVVKLKTPKQSFILKLFFENPIDGRDRFSAETRFYDYTDTMHVEQSSHCLASSRSNQAILLEFIEGKHLTSSEIDDVAFLQMMDFIFALNDENKTGASLPMASENYRQRFKILPQLTLSLIYSFHLGIASEKKHRKHQKNGKHHWPWMSVVSHHLILVFTTVFAVLMVPWPFMTSNMLDGMIRLN